MKIIVKTGCPSFNSFSPFIEFFFLSLGNMESIPEYWHQLNVLNKVISRNNPLSLIETFPGFLSITSIVFNNDGENWHTQLEVKYNLNNGTITLNENHFYDLLKTINLSGRNKDLYSVLQDAGSILSNKLLCILLPPTENDYGVEMEFEGDESKPGFVVTSMNGHWEQVILRALYKKMGLGDEFELDGDEHLAPDVEQGFWLNHNHFNLIYSDQDNLAEEKWDKWWPLLSSTQQPGNLSIQKSPLHPEQADYEIPARPYTADGIQIWEGGGGYRTKVFRSAPDCLMRRQIGNKNLPVRQTKVPLCPVCEAYVRSQLLDAARYAAEPMEFRLGLTGIPPQ